jgi:hypothetical protein
VASHWNANVDDFVSMLTDMAERTTTSTTAKTNDVVEITTKESKLPINNQTLDFSTAFTTTTLGIFRTNFVFRT